MARKTIILTESQFNEICGANTAYLDNQSDYAKDGTIHMRTDGAAGNGEGDEYYSKPPTTDDIADSMAPETLFALLFRNGGHGLWGHWGSGLRADELEGFDKKFPDTDDDKDHEYVVSMNESGGEYGQNSYNLDEMDSVTDYDLFNNGDAAYYFTTDEPSANNSDTMSRFLDMIEETDGKTEWSIDGSQAFARRPDGTEIEIDAAGNGDFTSHMVNVTVLGNRMVKESNSELEGRQWNGNSYTNLTTKKTQYKQMLNQLVKSGAPKQQIKRVKAAYMGVCSILDRETGAIKNRKNTLKNLGMPNQFQKPGGGKGSGNGKAHTRKKQTDPNVGTGYITYAE